MNWFKQQLANVAGTQEPEYGSSAIQPVTSQSPQFTELTSDDLKWKAMDSTNVETMVFYIMTDEGFTAMAQLIYSNVAGIHTTAQFNSKIFNHDGPNNHLWCSDPLKDFGFNDSQTGFFAENVAIELNDQGDTYTIKSASNEGNLVNLKVKRQSPGFQIGKDGTSYFGTDPANPWGSMFHRFWPRCVVEGTMQTSSKTYNMKGRALYIKALQGMKPHHAAAKWNFVNFQTPTYSAVLMEYTTPPSYGRTTVSVGGIAKDGALLYAGPTTAQHTSSSQDEEIGWPAPEAILMEWKGKDPDGKDCLVKLEGNLPPRTDRVDVLEHIPGFIKSIMGSVSGARPYIFQYSSKDELKLNINGTEETGQLFMEATFITD